MATHTSTKPTSTQTLHNPPIVFKCINYQACKNKFLQGSLTFCKVFQGGLRFCKILKGMYIKCNITQSDNLTKCFPGRHFYLRHHTHKVQILHFLKYWKFILGSYWLSFGGSEWRDDCAAVKIDEALFCAKHLLLKNCLIYHLRVVEFMMRLWAAISAGSLCRHLLETSGYSRLLECSSLAINSIQRSAVSSKSCIWKIPVGVRLQAISGAAGVKTGRGRGEVWKEMGRGLMFDCLSERADWRKEVLTSFQHCHCWCSLRSCFSFPLLWHPSPFHLHLLHSPLSSNSPH